jgi:hypothetical protein
MIRWQKHTPRSDFIFLTFRGINPLQKENFAEPSNSTRTTQPRITSSAVQAWWPWDGLMNPLRKAGEPKNSIRFRQ